MYKETESDSLTELLGDIGTSWVSKASHGWMDGWASSLLANDLAEQEVKRHRSSVNG